MLPSEPQPQEPAVPETLPDFYLGRCFAATKLSTKPQLFFGEQAFTPTPYEAPSPDLRPPSPRGRGTLDFHALYRNHLGVVLNKKDFLAFHPIDTRLRTQKRRTDSHPAFGHPFPVGEDILIAPETKRFHPRRKTRQTASHLHEHLRLVPTLLTPPRGEGRAEGAQLGSTPAPYSSSFLTSNSASIVSSAAAVAPAGSPPAASPASAAFAWAS